MKTRNCAHEHMHNLSKVLLNESKALQAAQKRDYNNEDANLCTRAYVAIP